MNASFNNINCLAKLGKVNIQKNALSGSSKTYYSFFLSLPLLVGGSSVLAEEIVATAPANTHTSVIHGTESSANHGVTTVNISAGNNNSQANVGVVAVGLDSEMTDTNSIIIQNNHKNPHQTPDKATASITGDAFSNSTGWTAINQSSGQGNMQANMMEIGIGDEYEIGTVNDQILAQSFSDAGESELAAKNQHSERSVNIDDTALSGMTGVVQVNQTAGANNVTSNTFVFQVNGNGLK